MELLVLGGLLLGCLEALKLLSLDELLAAEAFLSDEALDLGGLVVSLVTALDLALGNILANVVLLWVESEDGSNLVLSLLEETVRQLLVGAALNFLVALLHDLQGHDSEVRAGEATADRLSSSVASSLWVEERALFLEENACSAVLHYALLHGETLLVVSSGNFENVALVVLAQILSCNFHSHSLLIEWTTARQCKKLDIERDKLSHAGKRIPMPVEHHLHLAFIINLNFLLPT